MPSPKVAPKPFLGYCLLKKRGGSGPLSAGAERLIPFTMLDPSNPRNQSYEGVVNGTSFPSIATNGVRTPSITIETIIQPFSSGTSGWSDAALFNSLLQMYGTDSQTDLFCVAFRDNRSSGGYFAGQQIYDWMRCTQVTFSASAMGGPVRCTMSFVARWGDNDGATFYGNTNSISGEVYPSAPTFSTTLPSVNVKPPTSPCQWNFNGNLTGVRSFNLTLVRGQAPDVVDDGTCYVQDYVTGMYSGVATINQNPNTDTALINTNGNVVVNVGTNASGAGGFAITLALNTDNNHYVRTIQAGNMVTTASLIDLSGGGNPATFAAL